MSADQKPEDGATGHSIEWSFDRDEVTAKAVCHEDAKALCRHECPHECETLVGVRKRTSTAFDGSEITEWVHAGYDPVTDADGIHVLRPSAHCNITEWLNADGSATLMESCHNGATFTLATTPITAIWEGDYYEWEPRLRDEVSR